MKKLLLIPVLAVIFAASVAIAAPESDYNPTGDDDVERGYQEHQQQYQKEPETEQQEPESEPEDDNTNDNYDVKKSGDTTRGGSIEESGP